MNDVHYAAGWDAVSDINVGNVVNPYPILSVMPEPGIC